MLALNGKRYYAYSVQTFTVLCTIKPFQSNAFPNSLVTTVLEQELDAPFLFIQLSLTWAVTMKFAVYCGSSPGKKGIYMKLGAGQFDK